MHKELIRRGQRRSWHHGKYRTEVGDMCMGQGDGFDGSELAKAGSKGNIGC
jgi:hypothetical protein